MTDPFQGHIDVYLSNYAQQYRNRNLIADQVAPRVGVERQSDKYPIYGREGLQDETDDVRAHTAGSKQITMTLSDGDYVCPDHSLAHTIPAEDVAKPGVIPRRERATRIINDKLLLNHEVRTAAIVFAAASYPTDNKTQLSGTDQWGSGDAAATPFQDVDTGHSAIRLAAGVDANVLVMGDEVLSALRRNAEVIEGIKYTRVGGVKLQELADFFGVERVLVGSAIKRTLGGVNSFVWGKHAALLYVRDSAALEDLSFVKTFNWDSAPGTVTGFQVLIGPVSPPSAKANELSLHWYHDEKLTAAEAGYFIEDAVA